MEVSRAIDLIDEKMCWGRGKFSAHHMPEYDEYWQAGEMAIDALKKQEQDSWTPCSERLPEDEYVLISKMPTKLSGSKWSVAIAIRTADPRSGKIHWRDSGFGVIQDDKVLAWQPLPEPYREESNE